MRKVTDELTWSLSNRGYYIPIYTRCDSTSDAKLTLSPSWYLFTNYSLRKDILKNNFRELISNVIRNKGVLDNICLDDFEYLYGRDRVLTRSVVFICSTQPQEFQDFLDSMDVDSLISWAFNSKGHYHREFEQLPMVAQRLLLYGIILAPNHGIEEITYYDVSKDP